MKIVHVCGSPHSSISNTYNIVKQFINYLEKEEIKVELVNHFIAKEKISECRGCTRCMRKGDCVMKNDDIANIEKDLLAADLIIYSSPIYVLNVTSLMKKFFDRTAYMTHRLVLENKTGLFVLSSQGLGIENVEPYMKSVMEAMGINVLGSISGVVIFHGQFLNQDEIDFKIADIAGKITSGKYKTDISVSEEENLRRKKFAFLMDKKEISQKLFKEDEKYWSNRSK